MRVFARAVVLCSAYVTLSACSGGGGAVTPAASTTAQAPAAGATLSAASAAYLDLDLSNLANYANPSLPAYYDAQVAATDNTPAGNPVTNAGATLGRVIFNDPRLSTTGTIACASCHQQAIGFTDSAQYSTGVLGTPFTIAHAMRLGNVRYYQPGTMFWDKSAASIEAQAIVPIQNTPEMGWDAAHGGLTALVAKMSTLPYYPELFNFVYGSTTVTVTGLQDAVAQFERSMITTGSLWDQGYAQVYSPTAPGKNLDVDLPNFTAQQNRGRHLFMAAPPQGGVGCASCHVPPTFALAANALDDGLDANETTIFKAPSLKNDANGPYMHDGRFSTLAQVVSFYNSGIQPGPNLDPRLQHNGVPIQLNLSASDQAALVAFLSTLNDPAFMTDPRFTSPFKSTAPSGATRSASTHTPPIP
jgi:cytochrome c peroxidase